jgi:tRNA nucleotidyltransferase (CCA-adding enzyme)
MLGRLRPTPDEVDAVRKAADALLVEIGRLSEGRFEPILVGSAAKGTFLANPDIDVFMMFPEDTSREELERVGLKVGAAVLDGETRYAEHPYTHGEFMGFEADVVPCFKIEDATSLKSNVDRTPFHTEFIINELPEARRGDVLLLKGFMKGIGVYGAEIRVEGFSGYLCELLVIRYGTFIDVLGAASAWDETPIHVIDPPGGTDAWRETEMGPGRQKFRRPLNVIDPVDHTRNVSSALSREALDTFVLAASEYLSGPDDRFFFPAPRHVPDREECLAWLRDRKTFTVHVGMARPDLIDDILYSQIKKAHNTLLSALDEADFSVVTSDLLASDSIELIFEVHPPLHPPTMVRRGPPDGNDNAEKFRSKWKDKVTVEGGRLWAEVPRRHRTPDGAIGAALSDRGIGKDLNEAGRSAVIITGEAVAERAAAMSLLMDRRVPWHR